MLVADIGYTEASQRTGIKRDTLYKWGQRKGWKVPIQHAQACLVQSVQSAPRAHAEALAEHEIETKLSLARYARKAAKESETADMEDAPLVHKVGQLAGIVHKWGDEKPNQQFTLNVLNLNMISDTEG